VRPAEGVPSADAAHGGITRAFGPGTTDAGSRPSTATPRPPGAGKPPKTSGSTAVRRQSPHPGSTQALKVGPGDKGTGRAQVTTHAFRSQDRVNIKQDVVAEYDFRVPGSGGGERATFRGRLVDISLGGLQVEGLLPTDVRPDDLIHGPLVVHLRAQIPFSDSFLEVDSRVLWVKPLGEDRYALGLKFQQLTPEQQSAIRAFLIAIQSPTRTGFRRGGR
jgi:hypothetical protein